LGWIKSSPKLDSRSLTWCARHACALMSLAGSVLLGMCVGANGVASLETSARALQAGSRVHFAIADFDGDQKPDLATVQTGDSSQHESHYRICLQLSSGSQQSFGVTAPMGGLQLAPLDVNDDHILDLVVSTTWLRQPVAILLNDGHGKFTLADPRAYPEASRTPQGQWSRTAMQVQDNAGVPPPRFSAKVSVVPQRAAPAAEDEEFAVLSGFSFVALRPEFSCAGRAPPPRRS